jgi:hypothetical protein
MDPMGSMTMDSPPQLAAPATAVPMPGMSMDSPGTVAPGGSPAAHLDDSHADGVPDNHETAGAAGHTDSHTEALAPDAGTKSIILGTLGVFNAGVILTAAVLKRRQPKKTTHRPDPATSSVGDLRS